MASEFTTKVRLVRCPKCRLVLPELPDFNVYKCGGCGATLQAKNRVNNARSTGSGSNDVDAVQENQTDRVHEDREEPSSSNKAVLTDSGECSSSQNNESDQSKFEDCDGEQLRDMNVPSENLNNGTHQSESSDGDVEGSEASNEVFSPTEFVDSKNQEFALNENDELTNNENEVFASNGNEEVAHNENKELADNEEEIAHNEIEECDANGTDEFAHCEIGEFSHNENEEFAQNEIEEIPREFSQNEIEEFAHNETEEFPQEFSQNEIEELAHNETTEEFAHNKSEESAHNENEDLPPEFAYNKSEESAQNENEEITQGVACCENEEFYQKQNDEFAQNQTENFAHNENEPLALAGADLAVPVNGESSLLAEASTVETGKKFDSESNVRSSNAVNTVATTGNGSSPSAHMAARERIASDSLKSSSSELKQHRKSSREGFCHLRSEEFNPSSELSGTLGDLSKSPTRSSHAYDGSISSYDGMDDQFLQRHLHSLENAYKAANFLHSEELPRRDKFPARMTMNRDSEMQHQARPSRSDKNRYMKDRQWDRDEFLEPARHDRTVRNWRLERHEHHQPSSAFHRISSRASYGNRRPSSQLHDEFRRNSSFQSYECSEDPEQVKMKLLSMVLELQDQLDKTYSRHDKENTGISGHSRKTRHIPRYPNYEPHSEERFPPNYPRYSGRYGAGSNGSHRHKKIPFSGEATSSSSHQYDPSCSHRCPPDWQHSAQLPPPPSHYNTSGLCRIHPRHNYYTCYSSCPSSPQWSVDSEYPPWGRELQSDDQRRRSQDMTNYLREKYHSAKRHFRPIAGGAPFVVCYNCFKLLQLPADFLLFKKKYHRLRCGACLQVLKFSLQKGSHIVRYEVKAVDPPPPSEAEDYGDDIDRRNMASTSHTPHGDPVSCSDDYGLSYCKSYSTEGDPASSTAFHTPRGSSADKRILQDSVELTRYRKELIQSQGKNKSIHEFSGSSTNIPKSENVSSEIEELPPRSSSPLHRLMGYSSPSEVIFGPYPPLRGTFTSYSMQKEK